MSQLTRPKKLPRNYQAVFDVVSALPPGEHAAAGEICAATRRLRPGIGYSTVYRALERLRELDLVLEVRVPGSSSTLYEAARAHHAHFRCDACSCIVDVDYVPSTEDVMRIALAHQLAIDSVSVTFNGVCEHCAAEPVGKGRPQLLTARQ